MCDIGCTEGTQVLRNQHLNNILLFLSVGKAGGSSGVARGGHADLLLTRDGLVSRVGLNTKRQNELYSEAWKLVSQISTDVQGISKRWTPGCVK